MDISGYAWAMLDDFLDAIELLAPKGSIDLYLIFDACQNPRKKETSAQRREKTNQAASDLQKYINSKEVYKESKLKELMCKCVYPDNAFFAACYAWAKERGIKCFSSPFEADHQLAYMKFDYVLTIDTDIIMLGANVLCGINLHPDSKCFGEATLYDETSCLNFIKTVVPEYASLSNDELLIHLYCFCTFLGCDYVSRAGGLSPKFLIENFSAWCQSIQERESILQSIETSGSFFMAHTNSVQRNVAPFPDFIKKWKSALSQFLHPYVFNENGELIQYERFPGFNYTLIFLIFPAVSAS
jgi:hypothetical protein